MLSEYTIPGTVYAIQMEAVNTGIPYADNFVLMSNFCMTKVSANESRLTIYNNIKYVKSTWGVVKSNATYKEYVQ